LKTWQLRTHFPEAAKVVDVAGGSGAMMVAILTARPDLRGAVVDTPAVIEQARQRVAAHGMSDRCTRAGPRGG
jgi:ubiquinone/menaquinone biosynthesis C-methylase UbiE